MPVISLSDELQVTTFEPSAGSEALTASIDQLQEFGFPPTPDHPDFRAGYDRAIRRLKGRVRYVTPTFHVLGEVDDSPDVGPTAAGKLNSPNWCGGLVRAVSTPFSFVMGSWVVPGVGALAENHWYNCVSWVGVDGATTPTRPLIRLGVVSAKYGLLPIINSTGSFFFQWSPGPFGVVDVGCAPGDWVVAILSVGPVGSHDAAAWFLNRTRSTGTTFLFSTTGGQGVGGQTAEWIVSKTLFGGERNLGDFGEVFFDDCHAASSSDFVGGGTGIEYDTVDSSGSLIADSDLITPTVIRCRYVLH